MKHYPEPNNNELQPKVLDVQLNGSKLSAASEQHLPAARHTFQQWRSALAETGQQLLPAVLLCSAIYCLLFSFKTTNPMLAEVAAALAVIMVLLSFKSINNINKAHHED